MINCLLVDDDISALDLLENYIQKVSFLTLLAKCSQPAEAIRILNNQPVDLLFLDIRMPEITGIQLLKSIKTQPAVIFTTAYKEYAIDGFDLNICDYLLKPILFERFLKAVSNANEYIAFKQQKNHPTFDNDLLFVKSDYKIIKIVISEILFIEGLKDYVKIYTKEKNPFITLKSMTYFENKLPGDHFIRVHRSFIIAINKIDSISKNRIIIGDKYIPISNSFKEQFYKVITKNL